MSFFIAAALCDLERKTIPISLTVFGTVVGLVLSTLFPWPWPNEVQRGVLPADTPWYFEEFIGKIPRGICPWPVWGPLPNWLPPGSPQLGFLTSLAGAAAGTFMIRFIKWVFETGLEREALGLGDADFMMMVGAFTGWQIVLIGFFAGTFVAPLGSDPSSPVPCPYSTTPNRGTRRSRHPIRTWAGDRLIFDFDGMAGGRSAVPVVLV